MGHRRFHDGYFDKGLRGWIVKTAKKNYWRVAAWHDLDDLIQEGLLAYAICRHRYRAKVKNRRHFMALVQVVYINRITDLANERTAGDDIPISQIAADGKELAALEYLAGGTDGDQELAALLATAPAEVRGFLALFDTQEGLAELDKPLRRYKGGVRQTFDERLSQILGMPVGDIRAKVQELLAPPDPDTSMAGWAKFFQEVFDHV